MPFKSQSAMEYLMTYGWAILIIAIVMIALFQLGIFNVQEPRVSAGACEVYHGNDVGECQGVWPQFVAQFNGQSGISAPLPTNAVTGTTISAWFETTNGIPAQTIFLLGTGGSTNGYGLYLGGAPGWGCAANTYAILESVVRWICTSNTFNNKMFYNSVLVSTASSGNVIYTLYINGAPVYTSPSESLPYTPTKTFLIGEDSVGRNFEGSISNVQIYNTSLLQAEITALYDEGIGGAPIDPTHIVGWWPLNGNAQDYSGNNNNGVATAVTYGSTWTNEYVQP